jgi:hypothetical protein
VTDRDPQRRVHDAIGGLLDDGEIAIAWMLTIDVAGQDGTRYLSHRSGGGQDGTEFLMAWTALGMLQASAQVAEDHLRDTTDDEGTP